MSRYLDIRVDQGTSLFYSLFAKNFDRTPFNLAGFILVGKFGSSFFTDPNNFLPLTLVVTSEIDGIFNVILPAGVTNFVAPGNYVYNIDAVKTGASEVSASLNLGSGNSEILLTANTPGIYGNAIHIAFIERFVTTPLSITVGSLTTITVNLACNSSGSITTVDQFNAFLSMDPTPDSVVTRALINLITTGDGTGIIAAHASAPLAGGVDSTGTTHRLFNGILNIVPGVN